MGIPAYAGMTVETFPHRREWVGKPGGLAQRIPLTGGVFVPLVLNLLKDGYAADRPTRRPCNKFRVSGGKAGSKPGHPLRPFNKFRMSGGKPGNKFRASGVISYRG